MRRWLLACLNALGTPWGLAVPLPTLPEDPYLAELKRQTEAAIQEFWRGINRQALHDYWAR